MIRNMIFDMGQVLVRFTPTEFVARCTQNPADATLLLREVFQSVEWAKMDSGVLTEAEAEPLICARLPQRLHAAAHTLLFDWNKPISPVPGMAALLAELKARGYTLYLLSNASVAQHDYWPRVPGSEYFSGTIISADWRFVKPQPEIYRTLYYTFALQPRECLFIDDAPQNIAAAEATGMPGILFRGSAAELRAELAARGLM